jgi:hypothetical protein
MATDAPIAGNPDLATFQRRALLTGFVSLVLCAICVTFVGVSRLYVSYLVAFVFWVGISLGSLAIFMLHQLSGGNWGVVIRRPLESATRTLPLMAVLFLPLIFGMGYLYEWAHPEAVASDHVLQHKSPYLNVPFFFVRAAIYFGTWLLVMALMARWSTRQDETGDRRISTRMQLLAGPGLVLYALTVTFASVDWVMSRDAHWFSTIFGVLAIGGQALGALSLMVAVLVLLARQRPLADVVRPSHFHDLGKLMLAFVMLWAYFNLSQFLIIWAGNLPEALPWYLRRLQGNWKWVGLALVLGHFAMPFALLLSADLKKRSRRLASVALLVLVMRVIDTIWLVAPEFHSPEPMIRRLGLVTDVLALVGVGGIWLWVFFFQLGRRPLLPRHDPNWETAETT